MPFRTRILMPWKHSHGVDNADAYILREGTGTSAVARVARLAAELLAEHDIPHLIAGGVAVQEHGYPRTTVDVDIIVPDVQEARELITGDLSGPFVPVTGFEDTVRHVPTGVPINFLPAGKVLKSGCKVPFPMPKQVSSKPCLIVVEDLIALKLDSWSQSPTRRHRDKSDVIELISRRKLPRDLAMHPAVSALYQQTWDALDAEKE